MSAPANTGDSPSPRLALSPSEAARAAGIGRTTLYLLMSTGQLASFKIGTRRLIRVAALEAWMTAREAGQ